MMITVENLTKSYRGTVALRDASFTVERGEIFAIVGPNGSGKTTLLRCLAGLAAATSGAMLLNGRRVGSRGREWKRLFSYLPQGVAFPDKLTAREILAFYCRLRGAPKQAAELALQRLGLDAVGDRPVREYSGGTIQRLGLAVALLPDAPVLLLDEPTAGLDPELMLDFRRLLLRARDESKAVVLSSHMLSEVEAIADRVGILVQGRMVAIESVAKVRERLRGAALLRLALLRTDERWRTVACAAGATRADLVDHSLIVSCRAEDRLLILRALESAGAGIESFSTAEPSLEDIYLRCVNESAHGSSPAADDRVPGRTTAAHAD